MYQLSDLLKTKSDTTVKPFRFDVVAPPRVVVFRFHMLFLSFFILNALNH